MSDWKIIEADVLEALKQLEDNSVDAILTDPPYGLGTREPTVEEIVAYLQGARLDSGGDFMNKKWELPPVEVWREMLRVLRPGGYVLGFGGTRMFDLLTVGVRAGGFKIRDVLSYNYASGMPKSLQLDKAIDTHFGAERPVIGTRVLTGNAAIPTKEKGGTYGVGVGTIPAKEIPVTGPATPDAARYEGWGTNLKPSYEPVILAQKPVEGTIAKNALAHGTGGLNIDGCRIGFAGDGDEQATKTKNAHADFGSAPRQNVVYGEDNSPQRNYDADGRWPANLILSHSPDCKVFGTRTVKGDLRSDNGGERPGGFGDVGADSGTGEPNARVYNNQLVETWCCVSDCPVAMLDAQSGDRPGMSGGGLHAADYGGGMFGSIDSAGTARGDFGGASRFFFIAKASRAEREFGCEHLKPKSGAEAVDREEGTAGVNNPRAGAGRTAGKVRNFHPTVKPIRLAKWLATLLLPPPQPRARRILIPYSGSGSEMIGAMRAGWDEIVGIQRTTTEDEAQYVVIAKARLKRWAEVPMRMDEGEAVGEARFENKKKDPRQASLFDAAPTPLDTPIVSPPPTIDATPPTVVSEPSVVQTPTVVSEPIVYAGTGIEMPFSELAKRLSEKGWPYTLQEIASWEPEKRLRAAKWVRGE